MNRSEKQQVVESLGEQLCTVSNLFLIDYRGLKVVVKNTLALRAAKEHGLEHVGPYLEGPTAVAFHKRDVVGMAKLLTEIAKSNPNFRFKGALIDGKVVPVSEIQAIASLPSREVLLSKLVFLLKAPLQRLAGVLKAPARDLALVLKQVQK